MDASKPHFGKPAALGYSRSRHRSANHESAHAADAAGEPDGKFPDHPLICHDAAELIDTDAALQQLLAHLRQAGSFAYDSEFIGELTYHPHLCLVQVASSQRIALIDPLADLDLRPFWELICDPAVEKIVHAGQQDIEPVWRHLQREAVNVFDTQIAAGFAAMAYPVALSKLVSELVGAKLGKSLTFTHWDQRPLSPSQLRYAADDVRFLPALRQELGRRLDAAGHADWAAEECAALCRASLYQFDPQTYYLRVRGASSLSPQALAVLRELTVWRDASARRHDVPPRSFLRDEIMVNLAGEPVRSVEKLNRVRGLPRPVEQEHGQEIVAATLRALALPAQQRPPARIVEPSPTQRFRCDALWAAVQCLCLGRGIDPTLATDRQEIGELFRLRTGGGEETGLRLLSGWRKAAVGDPLLELLSGRRQILLDWPGESLRARPQ